MTNYTFGAGVAQHTFCSRCGMHAFYIAAQKRGFETAEIAKDVPKSA